MLFLIFASMTFDFLAGRLKMVPGFFPTSSSHGRLRASLRGRDGVKDQFRNVRPVYLIVFGA